MVPLFVLLVKCVTVHVFLPELFSHGRFSITTISQTITACINPVQGGGLGTLHAVRFARETWRRLRWPYVALWDRFKDGRRHRYGWSCD